MQLHHISKLAGTLLLISLSVTASEKELDIFSQSNSDKAAQTLDLDAPAKDSFIFKLPATHNDYQASVDYLASDARPSVNSPLTLDAPDPHSFSVKPTVNNPFLRDGQEDCQYIEVVFDHQDKQLSVGSDNQGNPCSRSHLTISDYQITTRFKYEE
ncbi:hypothetical protein CAG60_06055 [Vibrio sp. V33_P6A3T137]|uniref:hypothetical protein n=1 Tax=Vibrio sp. V33_P6A3T137 TaxID=1938685 RepID=UPI0013723191|nr:hypothetical protein [Vibrio sp. V33_P6A3T137]NAW78442.1 hypothetical protein [Vibrio sp. V33_P6A3T137]